MYLYIKWIDINVSQIFCHVSVVLRVFWHLLFSHIYMKNRIQITFKVPCAHQVIMCYFWITDCRGKCWWELAFTIMSANRWKNFKHLSPWKIRRFYRLYKASFQQSISEVLEWNESPAQQWQWQQICETK